MQMFMGKGGGPQPAKDAKVGATERVLAAACWLPLVHVISLALVHQWCTASALQRLRIGRHRKEPCPFCALRCL